MSEEVIFDGKEIGELLERLAMLVEAEELRADALRVGSRLPIGRAEDIRDLGARVYSAKRLKALW